MDVIDSIILGVIQGLTEFLPVSSSGHLEIGKALLGDTTVPKESLLFTVVLHFATALSTIVVFRNDIIELLKGIFKLQWNEEMQFMFKILISMLPAVFIGLFFEKQLASLFGDNLLLVGVMLLVTAALLFMADKATSTEKPVGFKDALIIGVAQAIAMLPGMSRSGATISTSVLLGNDKSKAARFSFLMVVPLIFGKIAQDILSGNISIENGNFINLGAGFIAAFLAGLVACTWMIRIVRKSKLTYFAIYCILVGFVVIIYSLI